MSQRKLFSKCFSTLALATFLSVTGQSALGAEELRYLGWADYVHEAWVRILGKV